MRETIDEFEFVGIVLKQVARLGGTDFPNSKGMATAYDFLHPVFNPLQVFFAQFGGQVEVVVEPVFNGRANRGFGARKLLDHGLRHDVRE